MSKKLLKTNNAQETLNNIKGIVDEIIRKSKEKIKKDDLESFETVILNIRGTKFEVYKNTLDRYPNTRLGKLVNARSVSEQLKLCQVRFSEFYFDRDPSVMNLILGYYLTGKLHLNITKCVNSFKDELSFWEIDDDQISVCCKLNYFNQLTDVEGQIEFENRARRKFRQSEYFGTRFYPYFRKKVWQLFERPKSSILAQV